MSKFLNDFLLTMPDTQRQKLMEMLELKKKSGSLRTEQEFKQELEYLLGELNKRQGEPTFIPVKQEGLTNSKSYNSNMDSIHFDLITLFEASSQIERLITDNQQLSRSLLSDVKKKMYTMKAKVERYKLLIKNSDGFDDGVFEQFKSPEYTETDEQKLEVLRTERFGQVQDKIYNAENQGYALQLAGIQSLDQLKTSYGRKLARIEVVNRVGVEASNNKHKIDLAIDGSADTFWAESIIVDDVITQNMEDLWSHDYKNYPKSGAIAELEIKLNGLSTVSEVHFDPYAAYPLEVVAIHGYETHDQGGAVYELVTANHENMYQRSQKSTDRMIFQFPSVEISKIRILIRQENYVRENFIVNQDELNNIELWDQVASSEQLIADAKSPGETMAEFDKKNEITGWTTYLNKLKEWAEGVNMQSVVDSAIKAMEIIKTGDYKNPMLLALRSLASDGTKGMAASEGELAKEWLAVNKLSYLYGAYNISIFGRKYRRSSIYVTKPLPLSSNASRIVLETDEKHHDIVVGPDEEGLTATSQKPATARITDIEYYITYKKNPLPSDWKPILPAEKAYVEGELLLGEELSEKYLELNNFDGAIFSFRFQVISTNTVTVRRNGYPLPKESYIITDDGKKIGIKREHYSPSSIYTVDYKAHDSAYMVSIDGDNGITPTQFIDVTGEAGESFDKASLDNTIELKYQPYIFRDQVFSYDDINERYDEDATSHQADDEYYPIIVRVKGKEFKNITEYVTRSYDPDRLKENEGKTFAQIGNKIIFGRPTDGSKIEDITIDYYYITTSIRLKAIMRRNHAGHESITPALYSYRIKCQSYDQEA